MASLFPKYLDKTVALSGSRSGGKPVTTYSSSVANWLASKLAATQGALGQGFGMVDKLGLDHGATGAAQFTTNMNARCRMEIVEIDNIAGASAHTPVLFIHTTNGGTNQRFKAAPVTVYYATTWYLNTSAYSSANFGWRFRVVPAGDILYDSSGYPYGVSVSVGTKRKSMFFITQGWEQ